jgi:hypothetical protein
VDIHVALQPSDRRDPRQPCKDVRFKREAAVQRARYVYPVHKAPKAAKSGSHRQHGVHTSHVRIGVPFAGAPSCLA